MRTDFRPANFYRTFFRLQIFVTIFVVPHFFVTRFFVAHFFVVYFSSFRRYILFVYFFFCSAFFFVWTIFRSYNYSSNHLFLCAIFSHTLIFVSLFFRSNIFFVQHFFVNLFFRTFSFSSTCFSSCCFFHHFLVQHYFRPSRFSVHTVFRTPFFRLGVFRSIIRFEGRLSSRLGRLWHLWLILFRLRAPLSVLDSAYGSKLGSIRLGSAWSTVRLGSGIGDQIGSMDGELLKRDGVLLHWWPFISKRNDRLQLVYTDITLI